MAVKAIDNSIGKNNPKTGSNKVPKPKPEKSVNPDPRNATKQMIMYSMFVNLRKYTDIIASDFKAKNTIDEKL